MMTFNQAIRRTLLLTPQSITSLHFRFNQIRGSNITLETFGPEFRKWRNKNPNDYDESEGKTRKGHTYKKFAKNKLTIKKEL